jgi:hypothetical protein
LIDIGQTLAPALGKAATAAASDAGDSLFDLDVDDPRISSGIAALAGSISKEKMRMLINTMAKVSRCDGTPLQKTMEITFRGDLPLMYKWLWFALEVNFKNFSDWLSDAISGVSKPIKAARSRRTSKGSGQQ